jgi:hypothetical protein
MISYFVDHPLEIRLSATPTNRAGSCLEGYEKRFFSHGATHLENMILCSVV